MQPFQLLAPLIALACTGCYTQLASGGYARRAVDPAAGYAATPSDSGAGEDSLAAAPQADTLRPPQTVIVNNYWRESPYYRGYAIDAWDYPGFTLGFYSSGYRDYYGPYWWDRGHGYRRDYRYRSGYSGGYHGGTGGGTVITAPSGNYKSDKRIFAPEPDRPDLRKGRRSETVPAPAPKASEPAPAVQSPAPAPAPTPAPEVTSGSSGQSQERESVPSESKTDHPRPQKGKRR